MNSSSNTGSTKERLRTNDESLTPDQMKMYERELQMRLSLIKDAEERLFAIEKEYMQTKQTSNENIRAFESTTQEIKSDSRRHFASPGYYPLPIEREMSPKSKYYKQQLYREELEKQILEAKKKKMAQENALAIRETTSNDSTLVFDGKNSPPKDIKINYVLDYSQSSPSDQNYFAYGQNDLVKSSSPLTPLSTSFAEEANADLGCADYQVQCNKQFPNSQNSKKVLYAQELRQQIEEARRKKELQKRKDEEFDRKIEEESAKYDPFDLNITQGHLKHAPTIIFIFRNPSLSIEQLAAKNEQRLKRLDAMQLLNDIDADPEAVLQRFIEKHEGVHSMNPRFPCY
ncbi:hypothetical protein FGIG_10626 [Fasciola gigantica]|uniref:Uncharacterized protein n=1 Tax=Fasciola gigantica TaxID=46835 RepID=A0A504Y677_FASGI|nr:hypothetical protein FGIG_10626 [Fasciola gigantica]